MPRHARFSYAAALMGCLISLTVDVVHAAASSQARCLLEVRQKRYIDGPCPLTLETDGSFTVGASETQSLEYFAIVSLTGKNTADGFWNEEKGANHAHGKLGTLKRNGACWQNAQAKVCAWKTAP